MPIHMGFQAASATYLEELNGKLALIIPPQVK